MPAIVSFLSPGPALAAALIAIPALLLLYILKLRRRMMRIPSTMLWESTREDMEANTPFRRLRFSLLLLLQLAILLLILLAMAQPFTLGAATDTDRYVLLIDRSASMNAITTPATETTPAVTRLDAARQAATDLLDQVLDGSRPASIMLIAFAGEPVVECSATSDRRLLAAALESIRPTDEPADLQRAMDLAAAHARPAGSSETATPAEVVLVSDGGIGRTAEDLTLDAGSFRFVRIDAPTTLDNVGIVAFAAERPYEDPGMINVFVRAVNTGADPVETAFTLRLDDQVGGLTSLTIPGATGSGDDAQPGEATTLFSLEASGGGLLEITHARPDAFAADDSAWLVMPAPRPPRAAIVHEGPAPNPFLVEVLEALEPGGLRVLTAARIDDAGEIGDDGLPVNDLIVYDRVAPARLPAAPSITFGAAPGSTTSVEPPSEGGQRLVTWDRRHPVLRHVDLDQLAWAGFDAYGLPDGATPLARGRYGPVIALLDGADARHLCVGFDLGRSNWAVDVSFTVFMLNAIEHLTLAESAREGAMTRPGESVTIRPRPGAEALTLTGPLGTGGAPPAKAETDEANGTPPVRLATEITGGVPVVMQAPRGVGHYAIDGALPPGDRLAVSLLSDEESALRLRGTLTVNARPVAATGTRTTVPREWWRLLAAAAGVLLLLEWLMYCLRMNR
jgi:hypothetical protein